MANLLHPPTDNAAEVKEWLRNARVDTTIALALNEFFQEQPEAQQGILTELGRFRDGIKALVEAKDVNPQDFEAQFQRLKTRYITAVNGIVDAENIEKRTVQRVAAPMMQAACWGGAGLLSGKVQEADLGEIAKFMPADEQASDEELEHRIRKNATRATRHTARLQKGRGILQFLLRPFRNKAH